MAPRKVKEDSDTEWTPKSTTNKVTKTSKSRKAQKARKASMGAPKSSPEAPKPSDPSMPIFNDEDWRTVAALYRLGMWDANNGEIARKLGITSNAWYLRMMRLRTRLDKVELNLIDGAEDTDPANIGNIVNTRTPPRASTKGRKPRKSDTPKPRK